MRQMLLFLTDKKKTNKKYNFNRKKFSIDLTAVYCFKLDKINWKKQSNKCNKQ